MPLARRGGRGRLLYLHQIANRDLRKIDSPQLESSLGKISKVYLYTFEALSVKLLLNSLMCLITTPEQIGKIVERLTELLTPHLPARGRLASLGAGALAKAATT